jgi:hypothetical protein
MYVISSLTYEKIASKPAGGTFDPLPRLWEAGRFVTTAAVLVCRHHHQTKR